MAEAEPTPNGTEEPAPVAKPPEMVPASRLAEVVADTLVSASSAVVARAFLKTLITFSSTRDRLISGRSPLRNSWR